MKNPLLLKFLKFLKFLPVVKHGIDFISMVAGTHLGGERYASRGSEKIFCA